VRFRINNNTDADAIDGYFVFVTCPTCKIVGDTGAFTKIAGDEDYERNRDFQHVFAHSRSEIMQLNVEPPSNLDTFQVGLKYRCKTCAVGGELAVNVATIILGPRWRTSPSMAGRIIAKPKS
jgi:hypothetical protein